MGDRIWGVDRRCAGLSAPRPTAVQPDAPTESGPPNRGERVLWQQHEAIEAPANDPTPSPSRAEAQPRPPLVSADDLRQVQRELLPHLATCRDCCIEGHLYCRQAERAGNGYAAYLTEFPDAGQRHADYVAVVIQARIRGLQAGFRALDALTRQEGEDRLETACRPVYGIDNRPAELAFVNHFTACSYCFPRSGKYCGEGRELHELAMMETLQ